MSENIQKVLALKYRPKNFKELIGQNIMVETITNSIQLNKLPRHCYHHYCCYVLAYAHAFNFKQKLFWT